MWLVPLPVCSKQTPPISPEQATLDARRALHAPAETCTGYCPTAPIPLETKSQPRRLSTPASLADNYPELIDVSVTCMSAIHFLPHVLQQVPDLPRSDACNAPAISDPTTVLFLDIRVQTRPWLTVMLRAAMVNSAQISTSQTSAAWFAMTDWLFCYSDSCSPLRKRSKGGGGVMAGSTDCSSVSSEYSACWSWPATPALIPSQKRCSLVFSLP